MRWRQTEQAAFALLTPEARKRLREGNVQVKTTEPTGQAQYSPFAIPFTGLEKTVTLRSGMSADDVRHELTHAGLDVAPDLFPGTTPLQKFANSALGTLLGQTNFIWNASAQMKAAESPAITMGGALAYPGFTPSNVPQDFGGFFNTQAPSWQYPAQTAPQGGWNIGR